MRQFLLFLFLLLIVVLVGGFFALGLFPLPLHQQAVHQTLPTSAIASH